MAEVNRLSILRGTLVIESGEPRRLHLKLKTFIIKNILVLKLDGICDQLVRADHISNKVPGEEEVAESCMHDRSR